MAETSRREPKLVGDHKGNMEWLPISLIGIDERAQRLFVKAHADHIAAELDPDLLGKPLVVAILKKNGDGYNYICADGQHRIEAVKIALGDDQRIECEVIVGDVTLAAKLYRGRNDIRRPRVVDRFLAGITAQHPETVQINNIVKSHDLRIGRSQTDGTLACVSALVRIYRIDQGALLHAILSIVISAWGLKADALNGDVMSGLAMLCRRYPNVDKARLVTKLASTSSAAAGVLGRARTFRDAMGNSLPTNVARALVAMYNTGMRTGKLAEWDSYAAQVKVREILPLTNGAAHPA
jgi:hypothetical protein